eukprot:gene4087-8126_t
MICLTFLGSNFQISWLSKSNRTRFVVLPYSVKFNVCPVTPSTILNGSYCRANLQLNDLTMDDFGGGGGDRNDEKDSQDIRLLRDSYASAKMYANEFSTTSNLALHLRVHGQQAARVYSALSTLLYASISISKADELERFVKKKSSQLPLSVFDIDKWAQVLSIANRCRHGDIQRVQDEYRAYRRITDFRLKQVKDTSSLCKKSSDEMKNVVGTQLSEVEQLMTAYCLQLNDEVSKKVIAYETKIEDLETDKKQLQENIVELNNVMTQLEEKAKADAEAAEQRLQETITKMEAERVEEKQAMIEAHEIENNTNRKILEETRIKFEEDKAIIDQKREEADRRVDALIKAHEEQSRQLIQSHENQIIERLRIETETQERHRQELETAGQLLQQSLAEMDTKHELEIKRTLETHQAHSDDLNKQLSLLEKLRLESIETGKQEVELEKTRGHGQLAASEAAHVAKVREIAELHGKAVEQLQSQITMLEKLHQDAIEAGKLNVEAEIRRGKEQVETEVQFRKQMEEDLEQSRIRLEDSHSRVVENFKREIARLEKLHQDSILEGKEQVQLESQRGQEMIAAEIALRLAQENEFKDSLTRHERKHADAADQLKSQIAMLEKLHQDAIEAGKAQHEAEIQRGKELVAAEIELRNKIEADHASHLNHTEVKNKDTLDMTSENFKSEIKRLEKLHQDAIEEGRRQAEEEAVRGKGQLAAAEAAYTAKVAKAEENHKEAAENFRREIERLEKLHQDEIERGRLNVESELARSKAHKESSEETFNVMLAKTQEMHSTVLNVAMEEHAAKQAKAEEAHAFACENFKREIARLEKLRADISEVSKMQIQEEKARNADELADQVARGNMALDKAEAIHNEKYNKMEAELHAKLAQESESHNSTVENLKREINRLERLHQDAIEAGKMQGQAEVQRGRELVGAEVQLRKEMEAEHAAHILRLEAKHKETLAISTENFKREIERLEKLHQDAIETGQRNTDAEVLRGQSQLAAAEVAFLAKLAMTDENRLESVDNFKREIERLERLHQEAIETGKQNTEAEAVRGQNQMGAMEVAHNAQIAKLEETHTAAVDNFKREIERLERLHQDSIEASKQSLAEERQRAKEELENEITRGLAQLAAANEAHASAISEIKSLQHEQLDRETVVRSEAIENLKEHIAKQEQLHAEVLGMSNKLTESESQHGKDLLTAEQQLRKDMEAEHISALNRAEIRHKETLEFTSSNFKREIDRLEKLLQETGEAGKEHREAEAVRGQSQLSTIEAAHTTKLAKIEESHAAICDTHKREIARLEKLYQDAVEAGKVQFEAEIQRGKELVAIEIQLRKEMEVEHAAQLTRSDAVHKEMLSTSTEAFKLELDKLEKLYQDSSDSTKQLLEREIHREREIAQAEEKRSKERLTATEVAFGTAVATSDSIYEQKLAKIEEAHITVLENTKREVIRLEKLHQNAVEYGKEQTLAENVRYKEQLAQTEKSYIELLEKEKEANNERCEVLNNEIYRLKQANQDTTMDGNDELEAEKIRSKDKLAAVVESYTDKLETQEKNHIVVIENLKTEIARLEKLHRDTIESNKQQLEVERIHSKELVEAESKRGKEQLAALEMTHVTALAQLTATHVSNQKKSDDTHMSNINNLKKDILRLEKTIEENNIIAKQSLEDERQRSQLALDAEISRSKETHINDESAYKLSLQKAEETFILQQKMAEETNNIKIENLKREIERLEKTHKESVVAAEERLQLEIQREKASQATASAEHAIKLQRADEAHAATRESHKLEIDRILKMHQDAIDISRAELALERNRGKEQLEGETQREREAAAKMESGYAASLAKSEAEFDSKLAREKEVHAIAIEALNREIERLKALHLEAVQVGKQGLEAEKVNSKVSIEDERSIRNRLEQDHEAILTQSERNFEATLKLTNETHQREIERLEKILETMEKERRNAVNAEVIRSQQSHEKAMESFVQKVSEEEKEHKITVEKLHKDIEVLNQRLEAAVKAGQDQVAAGKLQNKSELDAEINHSKEKLAAAEIAHATALTNMEEAHKAHIEAVIKANQPSDNKHKEEIEKLEKRLQESDENTKQSVAQETARSKEQLSAAEAAYNKMFLQAQEAHNVQVTELQEEIARLRAAVRESPRKAAKGSAAGGADAKPVNVGHKVDFSARLKDEHLDSFDENKKQNYINTMARQLGVSPSQIKITGLEAGSVIIHTNVDGLEDSSHADRLKEQVNSGSWMDSLMSIFGGLEIHKSASAQQVAPTTVEVEEEEEINPEQLQRTLNAVNKANDRLLVENRKIYSQLSTLEQKKNESDARSIRIQSELTRLEQQLQELTESNEMLSQEVAVKDAKILEMDVLYKSSEQHHKNEINRLAQLLKESMDRNNQHISDVNGAGSVSGSNNEYKQEILNALKLFKRDKYDVESSLSVNESVESLEAKKAENNNTNPDKNNNDDNVTNNNNTTSTASASSEEKKTDDDDDTSGPESKENDNDNNNKNISISQNSDNRKDSSNNKDSCMNDQHRHINEEANEIKYILRILDASVAKVLQLEAQISESAMLDELLDSKLEEKQQTLIQGYVTEVSRLVCLLKDQVEANQILQKQIESQEQEKKDSDELDVMLDDHMEAANNRIVNKHGDEMAKMVDLLREQVEAIFVLEAENKKLNARLHEADKIVAELVQENQGVEVKYERLASISSTTAVAIPVETKQEKHHVDFSARLKDHHLDSFDEKSKQDYIVHVAKQLGVHPSQVQITGLEAGSVVVHTKVIDLRDSAHADSIKASVNDSNGGFFSSMASRFGSVGLHKSADASTVTTTSVKSETSTPSMIAQLVAAAVTGSESEQTPTHSSTNSNSNDDKEKIIKLESQVKEMDNVVRLLQEQVEMNHFLEEDKAKLIVKLAEADKVVSELARNKEPEPEENEPEKGSGSGVDEATGTDDNGVAAVVDGTDAGADDAIPKKSTSMDIAEVEERAREMEKLVVLLQEQVETIFVLETEKKNLISRLHEADKVISELVHENTMVEVKYERLSSMRGLPVDNLTAATAAAAAAAGTTDETYEVSFITRLKDRNLDSFDEKTKQDYIVHVAKQLGVYPSQVHIPGVEMGNVVVLHTKIVGLKNTAQADVISDKVNDDNNNNNNNDGFMNSVSNVFGASELQQSATTKMTPNIITTSTAATTTTVTTAADDDANKKEIVRLLCIIQEQIDSNDNLEKQLQEIKTSTNVTEKEHLERIASLEQQIRELTEERNTFVNARPSSRGAVEVTHRKY